MKSPDDHAVSFDPAGPSSIRFHALALSIITVLGLLLYGHTLSFPFVFDDHLYLVDNPLVKDAHSFTFNGDFTTFANYSRQQGLDPDLSTNFILRPVAYLTFYLNYLVDGMNPRGFRAVNIVIHMTNALLFFLLLVRILQTSSRRSALTTASVNFIALFAALAFLVHPLQIESVTYIIQRFTSLGTLFYLGTIFSFLVANKAENSASATLWRSMSITCLIIGMLVKEFLFTAPFMLLLLDSFVMGTPLKTATRRILPYFFCLPIIPTLILFTSQAQNEGTASLSAAINITNGSGYTPYQYGLTQLNVILTYLRLILFPVGLNLDWDYPLTTSLLYGPALLSALVIIGLISGSWLWYRQHRQDVRYALMCYFVFWFFVTLTIDSSIVPLPDLLAEHRSYLPCIGILGALTCSADCLRTRFFAQHKGSCIVPAFMTIWILALAMGTNVRHQTWRSEVALWEDTKAKSPQKFRPWLNLGTAYFEHSRPQAAISCIRKAITLQPTASVAYRNLARAENSIGHYREALDAARLGVWLAPTDSEMQFELGMAYVGLGNMKSAEGALKKSISIRFDYRPAHLALGGLYASMKQYDNAMEYFKTADSLQSLNAQQRQAADHIARQILEQKVHAP